MRKEVDEIAKRSPSPRRRVSAAMTRGMRWSLHPWRCFDTGIIRGGSRRMCDVGYCVYMSRPLLRVRVKNEEALLSALAGSHRM